MDYFSKYHPAVCFSFFAAVIVLTLLYINPAFAVASFLLAFLYLLRLSGRAAVSQLFKFILPLAVLVAAFNTVFVQRGTTVLFSLFGRGFYAEGMAYGAVLGLMLTAVIMWFSCYMRVMPSEKFTALFGGFAPNLALLISMVFRFIPNLLKTAQEIKEAQIGLGNEVKGVKNSISRFSALVSISLESSIETADAMHAKGFGTGKRRFYNRYRFRTSDYILLPLLLLIFAAEVFAKALGAFDFFFTDGLGIKNFSLPVLLGFICLAALPSAVDLKEDVKWKLLKQKI
jgi:energy-coupling factor transport system permease protein